MIAGIVEHHDHAAPASLVAQQLLREHGVDALASFLPQLWAGMVAGAPASGRTPEN